MDTTNKFSKFVAKLEQKMLDSNQESLILVNEHSHIGGLLDVGINSGSCINASDACNGSINGKCSNSKCDNSMNTRKCTVIAA